MDNPLYISVPTWDNGVWTYTDFATKKEYRLFVKTMFKVPGKYGFDKTAFLFNEHATNWLTNGRYCEAPEGSIDFINYWDTEKEKCRKGCIFKNGNKTWYLTRFYYHWINFLRIYRKAPPKGFFFPDVRDVQYHMALYELLAELHNKNSVILKKRQIASSYFHIAKIYNRYIFEDGFVAKILASDKAFINNKGSWKFLEEYHNFTNQETAWVRHNSPDQELIWQQKLETKTHDARKVDIGTKAAITGITLDKDPVKGVGGACDEVFYEEGGVAPTADTTYNYMRAAMEEGGLVTGHFCIAGSVGDLSQCEPLARFLLNPTANDFYGVETDLLDENGTEGVTGLFIPEQWGMPGGKGDDDLEEDLPPLPNCIDEFGNSEVEKALAALTARYEYAKRVKDANDYQHLISQKPRNIAEALAIRKVSPFPLRYTAPQVRRIEDNTYNLEYVELERDDENKIQYTVVEKKPIAYGSASEMRKLTDKTGVGVMHERPITDKDGTVPWYTYLGSIDPVETGDTKTSESMAAIYIYKLPVEVLRRDGSEVTTFMEGGKLVFELVMRYDDPNKTNEMLSRVCELYNAYTICEKNKPGWISYMQLMRRQRYIAHANDMVFDKEFENTDNTFKSYGYTKTTGLWKKIIQYGINSLSEVVHTKKKDNGEIERVIHGVERIPFIYLLKEMQNYEEGKNYDRVIAYCALMAFVSAQMAIRGVKKRIERETTPLEDKKNIEELRNLLTNRSPFRMGKSTMSSSGMTRKAFKNLH